MFESAKLCVHFLQSDKTKLLRPFESLRP